MLILAIVLSITLAVGTPFIVVAVRHEVRLRRIRLIDDFSRIFIDEQERSGPKAGRVEEAGS